MYIEATAEYKAIKDYYGVRVAKRSAVPLINHINEGLLILQYLEAALVVQQAFCLHPIFQSNEALLENYVYVETLSLSPQALVLTLEYRNIANQYLSKRQIDSLEEILLSPLPGVNQMLIADKVQNRKDFEAHHKGTHPRSKELEAYFENWLRRLGVTDAHYSEFCSLLLQKTI